MCDDVDVPERWFDDPDIIDQDSVVMKTEDSEMELGLALTIRHPCEIIITYDELKAAYMTLEASRQLHVALGNMK